MRYAPTNTPMHVWAYRIRLMPKIISASIPNARSSKHFYVSRRSIRSPRSNILPRRDSPHTTFPRWFRIRSTIGYRYATANAVDSSPLPLSYHTALTSHLDPTLPCGVTESCSLRELESHRLIGRLMMRRGLLLFVNVLRTGVRQGLKRLWPAVCRFRNSPWPP